MYTDRNADSCRLKRNQGDRDRETQMGRAAYRETDRQTASQPARQSDRQTD